MIIKLIKTLLISENGLALPAVLGMLAVGGLLIVPGMNFVSTNLNSVHVIENQTEGFYAADAGIEDVLWSLKHGTQPHTSLTGNVNGMPVTMNTINKGNYTLVAGEWTTSGGTHSSDLSISTAIVWNAGANVYEYTVTCTWSGPGQCKLIEVGARIPLGYNYQDGSAASFSGNLSTSEPIKHLDCSGAYMLTWALPQISITTQTQKFYVTGSGALEGDYGWARAKRSDVGYAGEITGTCYTVTATATQNGTIYGKIEADVMVSLNIPYVTLYEIIE